MRLDYFVADVMEQLTPFLPNGSEVRFDLAVENAEAFTDRNNHVWQGGDQKISFTVAMADNFRRSAESRRQRELEKWREDRQAQPKEDVQGAQKQGG